MNYLLKTPKGVFLVDAPNFDKACEYARLSNAASQSDGIEMIGGFGPQVRYASQLMVKVVVCDPDDLKKAIERYRDARVDRSWMGQKTPKNSPELKPNSKSR